MFTNFVTAVQNQDKRNIFKTFSGDVSSVPKDLQEFYINSNPIDVEIRMDNHSQIRFYSVDCLSAIKEEYKLPGSVFFFATMNGDPIYYKEGKIYAEVHGGVSKPELLANSFTEYIQFVLSHLCT